MAVEHAAEDEGAEDRAEALHLGQDERAGGARQRRRDVLADVEAQRDAAGRDGGEERVHLRVVVGDVLAVDVLARLDRHHQAAGAQLLAPLHRRRGLRRVPVVRDHHREQARRRLLADLGDVLVVATEDLLTEVEVAGHVEAEESLREDQLLLDAFCVEVLQAWFDGEEAGVALHRLAQTQRGLGRHHLAVLGPELPATVPELDAWRPLLQVLGELVDPDVVLEHVAVGGDDPRAGRPRRPGGGLRGALGGDGQVHLFGKLEHKTVGHGASTALSRQRSGSGSARRA